MKEKIRSLGWAVFYMPFYLLFQFLGQMILVFIYKMNESKYLLEGIDVDSFILDKITYYMLFAAVMTTAVYIIILKLRKININDGLGMRRLPFNKGTVSFMLGVGTLAISSMIMGALVFITGFEESLLKYSSEMDIIFSSDKKILLYLVIGIIGPIIEEIIFRGMIFKELEKVFNIKFVIIVQGILFGIYHMRPVQIIYASFVGIALGIVMHLTKSIVAPILTHIGQNTTVLMIQVVLQKLGAEAGGVVSAIIVLLGLIIFPIALAYLFKTREKNTEFKLE